MRVKELIEKLKAYPEDAYVLVTLAEYSHPVELDTIEEMSDKFGPYFYQDNICGFTESTRIDNTIYTHKPHPCIWLNEG